MSKESRQEYKQRVADQQNKGGSSKSQSLKETLKGATKKLGDTAKQFGKWYAKEVTKDANTDEAQPPAAGPGQSGPSQKGSDGNDPASIKGKMAVVESLKAQAADINKTVTGALKNLTGNLKNLMPAPDTKKGKGGQLSEDAQSEYAAQQQQTPGASPTPSNTADEDQQYNNKPGYN